MEASFNSYICATRRKSSLIANRNFEWKFLLTAVIAILTLPIAAVILFTNVSSSSVHSFVIGDGNDALRPVDSDSLSLGGIDEDEELSDGDTDPDYREV